MLRNDWRPRATRGQELDGRTMMYQGWWNAGSWTRHAFRAPFSPRRYQRPPVRGGRWFIRRIPVEMRSYKDRPWYAWTNGKAKRYNKSFETFEEAFAWANFVAETYRKYDDQTAISIIALQNSYPGKGQDKEFL